MPDTLHAETKRQSWHAFVLALRETAPGLFRPYDPAAIREEIKQRGVPGSVLDDVLDRLLSLDRRVFDPGYQPTQRRSEEERDRRADRLAEKMKALLRQELVVTLDLDMPMPDGRELGDWTIAELRKLNGAFAVILEKAGEGDNSRTVRQVMEAD